MRRIGCYVLLLQLLSASVGSADNDAYLIRSESLPDDLNFMPSLANGQLGFTVFGDAIYMNGVYNGRGGDSRRARLPNWLNVSVISVEGPVESTVHAISPPLYELDLRNGLFRWQQRVPSAHLDLEQRVYAHRYYDCALIYELIVQREETKDALTLKLSQQPGNSSDAFDFSSVSLDERYAPLNLRVLKGQTKEVEHPRFQKEPRTVFIAFSEQWENEKILVLPAGQRTLHYRFILTAYEVKNMAVFEMESILQLKPEQVLRVHATAWNQFWDTNFSISVEGNQELSHVINAGIFALANSLPAFDPHQSHKRFYGLSPTGLARGGLDADYEGHNFWDTEIWMLPVVAQFSTDWSEKLLIRRWQLLEAAQFNANHTGFKGARYPWESAYTGTEVTNPCCPEVAEQEVHISADIIFALEQHFAMTNNMGFLCIYSWPIIKQVAIYLGDRVAWDEETEMYHIKMVMGPDEDHWNVTDNVYTNVVFKMALDFAKFTQEKCSPSEQDLGDQWRYISQHMVILYDAEKDYHPQHDGYQQGEQVKQADVILLGYPLQFAMNDSTRLNDLNFYENCTRASGPAMTWSMFALNFLDVNETVKAHTYFQKSYQDYVRPEFKVWSETKIGNPGASNFLTGIGGFMQAIINGYAGIRYSRHGLQPVMEIRKSHLLPSSKAVHIKGIKFAQAVFDLSILGNSSALLTCRRTGGFNLELFRGAEVQQITTNFTIELGTETVMIKTKKTEYQPHL